MAVLAGIALLAGCGEGREAATPTDAATEAMPIEAASPETAATGMTTANGTTPGTYDVTAPDGTKMVSTLNADGTYQDTDAAGKVAEKGMWAVKDGRTCFDPEGDKAETCFSEGTRAADGSFEAKDDKGQVIKVTRRAG
jgi:hypothetical protein